eukprot:TRINITY_DN70840_c1_g1_i1.p1 TRINITY_DN70840_c1_g1~~TRINITY_DN70840_c1_g1_i1.p1  ORF type:complete len:553 (+),score=71.78 TRINITY_DN70840_c1_g1_i1:3889-5547(+)
MEPKSPYDAALEQLNLLKQQLEIEVQEEPLEPTQAAPTESDVLAIAIDVGNGKEETIDVGRGDNPDLLASMFCVKHGLNERQRVKLAKIIEKNMAEAGIDTKPVERPSQNTRFTKTAIQRSSSTVPKGNSNAASVRGTATGSPLGFEAWQNEIVQCLKDRRKPQNHPKINELSEKIVAGKNRGTVPTYMRLYKQALAKQKTERAKERLNQSAVLTNTLGTTSIKPPHASSKILNYGERMYEKHKRKKEEKQQEWVRLKAEKEQKEMRSATFHPSLNSRSQSLVRSRSLAKPEERLLRLGQLANEKMENVRNMKVEQEKLGCPFKPSIGRKSDQLALNKYRMLAGNRGNDKFGKLFEDSKRRNQERDKILSMPPDVECTFKPNTTLTKGYQMLTPQGKPLLMRLTGDKKVWTQKLNASLANVAVEYKPTTGRPPKIERNTAGLPIGDYLYSQSKVKREGLAKKVESELNELKKNAGTSIIKDESRKLVERMKDSSYQKLFEMLDSDEDGLITAKDVDISSNKFCMAKIQQWYPRHCQRQQHLCCAIWKQSINV